MNLYFYTLSFTSILSLALGIFVFYRNPQSSINRTWGLACLGCAIWSLFFVLTTHATDQRSADIYGRILHVAAGWMMTFVVHFCAAITGLKTLKNRFIRVLYFNSTLFTFLGFSDLLSSARPILDFNYYVSAGPVYPYYTAHILFCIGYSEYLLFKGLKNGATQLRNQIVYIITALSCAYPGGAASLLPVYGISIEPSAMHFMWLYVPIITYAILKHQLMDIRVIIRRSLIYALSIGIMTLIYFGLVLSVGVSFQNMIGSKSFISTMIIFATVALAFKYLERRMQLVIDKFFFVKTADILKKENEHLMEVVKNQDRIKSVATLAAGMAHEIKNPLTSIRTFAEYLPQKYDDPIFRNNFSRIVTDEVDRINNIVRQLLEFSKPAEPELKPIAIGPLLDETLSLMNSNMLSNNVGLVRDLTACPDILADKNQLKQVFLNLFLNSIQSMKNGGRLSVSSHTQPNGYVRISVSDTGCGMAKEQLSHLFDPFYTTREEGTGLGLAIVHSIIKKHGGKVEVQSDVGQGTTISVFLKSRD